MASLNKVRTLNLQLFFNLFKILFCKKYSTKWITPPLLILGSAQFFAKVPKHFFGAMEGGTWIPIIFDNRINNVKNDTYRRSNPIFWWKKFSIFSLISHQIETATKVLMTELGHFTWAMVSREQWSLIRNSKVVLCTK